MHSDNGHKILYLSHGAGPMPVLGDERHTEMVTNLKHLASIMPRPSAVLLVSAHWEAEIPTITSGPNPPLLYDYYGFPQESYELEYPAPGHPGLESDIVRALDHAGFDCARDAERGYDHGLFVPMMLMYPEADIPCVQLSLIKGLDPAQHLALGEALRALEQENLLIIGSGFSFHNMRAFFQPETAETRARNMAFDDWLVQTCSSTALDENERRFRLARWDNAPYARYCHPREEHLLPLHVCYGAAGRACSEFFRPQIFGKQASTYLW